jgi:hypothetical protein
VGVGGNELHRIGVDFEVDGPGIYVTGQGSNERGNALLAIGADLLSRNIPVICLAPTRGSLLYALRASAVIVDAPTSRVSVQLALAAFEPPFVLLVDEARQLQGSEADPVLKELLTRHSRSWVGVVVAAAAEDLASPMASSFLAEATRTGAGLILGPRQPRLPLFSSSVKIPAACITTGEPPGRGVLARRSGIEPIQVPSVSEEDLSRLPARDPSLVERLNNALPFVTPSSTVEELRALVHQNRSDG